MIDSGYVRLECDSLHITTHFPRGSAAERWFSASSLREDVRRFNSDPERVPGPFLVNYDECRLEGVDRYFHRIELPFSPSLVWRGDVLLAGGRRSAVLENRSTPQTIEIRPPTDIREATREQVGWLHQQGALAPTSFFQMRSSWSGPLLAELYFVGDHLVLADRRPEGGPYRIRVGGYELFDGRVVRIETGDWIQFSPSGSAAERGRFPVRDAVPTYLARVGSDSRVASFVRVQNEAVDRLYPIPYLQTLVQPFAQAMSNSLQVGGGFGERSLGDTVLLTLHRELGEELHRSLADWCRLNRDQSPRRPRAVSLLAMDAFSGAVRAMPSCPTDEEVSAFPGLSPAERERWLRNQNLLRHEIGSAGKPFWAAALATAYPNLLDLEVEAHREGGIPSVLGCRLPAPYADHAHAGDGAWVGLESFLASSCNRYVVEMATGALALVEQSARRRPCSSILTAAEFRTCFPAAAQGDSTASFRICDGLVRTVLSPDSRFVANDCNRLKLIGTEFRPVPTFGQITNVEWYHRGAPDRLLSAGLQSGGERRETGSREGYQLGRYRTGVWRRVIDALEGGGRSPLSVETRLRFGAVSPEEANLQLNKTDQLRAEWINVLLGGATSRWSNFQLAEALSRLMSGRAVEGELVDGVSASWLGARSAAVNAHRIHPLIHPDSLHDGVRRRVLHGMELVARPGGTAALLAGPVEALRDSLARAVPGEPYDLYLFAKTGTPTIAKHVPSRGQRLVREVFRYLSWDASASRIVIAPRGQALLAREQRASPYWYRWFEDEVRRPLETEPSLFRVAPGEETPHHPLYLVGSQLRLNPQRDVEVMRQGGVLVVGLLAVPRAQGRTASAASESWISACTLDSGLRSRILAVPPARALNGERSVGLSVAIFVDDLDIGEGSGRAVDVARAAIEPLGRYMLSEVRQKARSRTTP